MHARPKKGKDRYKVLLFSKAVRYHGKGVQRILRKRDEKNRIHYLALSPLFPASPPAPGIITSSLSTWTTPAKQITIVSFTPSHIAQYEIHTYKTDQPLSQSSMRMGRIGDGDVHAAYVEFRAKESDKVCYHLYHPYQTILAPIQVFIFINTRHNNTHPHPHPLPHPHTHTHAHQTIHSVSPHNASTANLFAQKIPPVSVNTCSSVPIILVL